MHKRVRSEVLAWLCAGILALALGTSSAWAATALSADVDAAANCTSRADLNVSWAGAGVHDEFGVATDRLGSNIGTFGPTSSANSDYNGGYQIPITTQQAPGSVVGSYAWVGTNPPAPSSAIEFFVLYNCTTHAVLLRCFGAYGSCPQTAAAGLAALPREDIPAASAQMLAAMMALILVMGAGMLRRGQRI